MPPLTNRLRAYPIRQVVQPLGSIAKFSSICFVKITKNNEEVMVLAKRMAVVPKNWTV